MARNKVRDLRRRVQKQQDEKLKMKQHIQYKQERAKLKKLINKRKSKAWIELCKSTTNTYDPQYKLASWKSSRPARLVNILPSNERVTIKEALKHLLDSL